MKNLIDNIYVIKIVMYIWCNALASSKTIIVFMMICGGAISNVPAIYAFAQYAITYPTIAYALRSLLNNWEHE